jgi:RNA polymerase sigma-70 factor (ECF subfamily)
MTEAAERIEQVALVEVLSEAAGDSLLDTPPEELDLRQPDTRAQLLGAAITILAAARQAVTGGDTEAINDIHRHRLVLHSLRQGRSPAEILQQRSERAYHDEELVRSAGHYIRRFVTPAPEEAEPAVHIPEQRTAPDVETMSGQREIPLLERLVAQVAAGDDTATSRLLGEIHPMVLRYCRSRLGRQETVIGSADDVAQEVCLAVIGALPNYTIKGLSFRAFVYGIAAHKVTDAFRAIGRNRSEPMAEIPDSAVMHNGPEQRVLAGELNQELSNLLHRLTPRQREVLILRKVVGLSAEETAHIVGSTPGAVRVTQHRATNRLRSILAGRPATE